MQYTRVMVAANNQILEKDLYHRHINTKAPYKHYCCSTISYVVPERQAGVLVCNEFVNTRLIPSNKSSRTFSFHYLNFQGQPGDNSFDEKLRT